MCLFVDIYLSYKYKLFCLTNKIMLFEMVMPIVDFDSFYSFVFQKNKCESCFCLLAYQYQRLCLMVNSWSENLFLKLNGLFP
jgi:hypothetical protein